LSIKKTGMGIPVLVAGLNGSMEKSGEWIPWVSYQESIIITKYIEMR
jgi:hypothetical protein